jgi:nucleosome binding factor SPN SPT16 subunit
MIQCRFCDQQVSKFSYKDHKNWYHHNCQHHDCNFKGTKGSVQKHQKEVHGKNLKTKKQFQLESAYQFMKLKDVVAAEELLEEEEKNSKDSEEDSTDSEEENSIESEEEDSIDSQDEYEKSKDWEEEKKKSSIWLIPPKERELTMKEHITNFQQLINQRKFLFLKNLF